MKVLIIFMLISCTMKSKKNEQIDFKQSKLYTYNWSYIHGCIKERCSTFRLISSIDQLGSLYLNDHKMGDELIKDFESIRSIYIFNDAVDDELIDWISAAKDYERIKQSPIRISNAKFILKYADDFFFRAMKKKRFLFDRTSNESLEVAKDYYLTYLYLKNENKDIDKVLLNLGVINSSLRYKASTISTNHYFKELIRRFSKSQMAQTAYFFMSDNIHMSYTGSGGDFTPESQKQLLKYFKDMAMEVTILPSPIIDHGPF